MVYEKISQLTKQKLHNNITILVIFMSLTNYNIKLNKLRKTVIQLNHLKPWSLVKDMYASVTLSLF